MKTRARFVWKSASGTTHPLATSVGCETRPLKISFKFMRPPLMDKRARFVG
jgi:hypothetical protein